MSARGSTLVIGYGNPGRLDDGLGPALAEAIEREAIAGVEVQSDYQLNAEYAAEVAGHAVVVFADASVGGAGPYFLRRLEARAATSFSSHSMRPEAVVALAEETMGWRGEAYLVGIRGYAFNEFGEWLSGPARENLLAATQALARALRSGSVGRYVTGGPVRDSARECAGETTCTTAST